MFKKVVTMSHVVSQHVIMKVAMDVSDIVVISTEEISDSLELGLLGKLGLGYDREDRALTYRVPDPCIRIPPTSPTRSFVHDENDPFFSIKDVQRFYAMLRAMYGSVVHWTKMVDSLPLHGFDGYQGSELFIKRILKAMQWTPRAIRQ